MDFDPDFKIVLPPNNDNNDDEEEPPKEVVLFDEIDRDYYFDTIGA